MELMDMVAMRRAMRDLTDAEWNALTHESRVGDRAAVPGHNNEDCPPGSGSTCTRKAAILSAHTKLQSILD